MVALWELFGPNFFRPSRAEKRSPEEIQKSVKKRWSREGFGAWKSQAKPVGISKSSKTFSTPTFLDHFEAPKRIFFWDPFGTQNPENQKNAENAKS